MEVSNFSKLRSMKKPVKISLILLSLVMVGLLLFLIWWTFIAIDYDVNINAMAVAKLSKEKPDGKIYILPVRLISIDYENRQACFEVYTKDKGWEKISAKEGEKVEGIRLREVQPNSIQVGVRYPKYKRGRPLSELWEIWVLYRP